MFPESRHHLDIVANHLPELLQLDLGLDLKIHTAPGWATRVLRLSALPLSLSIHIMWMPSVLTIIISPPYPFIYQPISISINSSIYLTINAWVMEERMKYEKIQKGKDGKCISYVFHPLHHSSPSIPSITPPLPSPPSLPLPSPPYFNHEIP